MRYSLRLKQLESSSPMAISRVSALPKAPQRPDGQQGQLLPRKKAAAKRAEGNRCNKPMSHASSKNLAYFILWIRSCDFWKVRFRSLRLGVGYDRLNMHPLGGNLVSTDSHSLGDCCGRKRREQRT
jgi:hypothetical protein